MRRHLQCRAHWINGLLLLITSCFIVGSLFLLSPSFAAYNLPSAGLPCAPPGRLRETHRPTRALTESPHLLRHLCSDVIESRYDQVKISKFMRTRKKFFLQLTDALNQTYRKQQIGPHFPQWTPPHLFYDLLGPIADICPMPMLNLDVKNGKLACEGLGRESQQFRNCTVLSIGSDNDYTFEAEVLRNSECDVSTFDCSVIPVVPESMASRVKAYRVCLGPEDKLINVSQWKGKANPVQGESYTMLSWPSLLRHVHLDAPPDLVKMDIEAWEFPVMRSIISSLKHLPSQLLMELHFGDLSSVEQALLFVYYMHEAGYVLMNRADNKLCPSCTEVTYKRIFCEPLDD